MFLYDESGPADAPFILFSFTFFVEKISGGWKKNSLWIRNNFLGIFFLINFSPEKNFLEVKIAHKK